MISVWQKKVNSIRPGADGCSWELASLTVVHTAKSTPALTVVVIVTAAAATGAVVIATAAALLLVVAVADDGRVWVVCCISFSRRLNAAISRLNTCTMSANTPLTACRCLLNNTLHHMATIHIPLRSKHGWKKCQWMQRVQMWQKPLWNRHHL